MDSWWAHCASSRGWRNWRIAGDSEAHCALLPAAACYTETIQLTTQLPTNRRDAGRRSSDATHAALSEALGRFGASGEWDGATPTASADSLGRSGPPGWAEDAADGSAV